MSGTLYTIFKLLSPYFVLFTNNNEGLAAICLQCLPVCFFARFTRSPMGRYSESTVHQYSCNGKPLRGFRQWRAILGEALVTLVDTCGSYWVITWHGILSGAKSYQYLVSKNAYLKYIILFLSNIMTIYIYRERYVNFKMQFDFLPSPSSHLTCLVVSEHLPIILFFIRFWYRPNRNWLTFGNALLTHKDYFF